MGGKLKRVRNLGTWRQKDENVGNMKEKNGKLFEKLWKKSFLNLLY